MMCKRPTVNYLPHSDFYSMLSHSINLNIAKTLAPSFCKKNSTVTLYSVFEIRKKIVSQEENVVDFMVGTKKVT